MSYKDQAANAGTVSNSELIEPLGVQQPTRPDLKAMSRDLTDAFIGYQWRLENPFQAIYDKEEAEMKYRSDYIFHNKVQELSCGVMQIVTKHL